MFHICPYGVDEELGESRGVDMRIVITGGTGFIGRALPA